MQNLVEIDIWSRKSSSVGKREPKAKTEHPFQFIRCVNAAILLI